MATPSTPSALGWRPIFLDTATREVGAYVDAGGRLIGVVKTPVRKMSGRGGFPRPPDLPRDAVRELRDLRVPRRRAPPSLSGEPETAAHRLADAYDAAMRSLGDPRRADRTPAPAKRRTASR
jgi:hypothetical protein